MFCLISFAFRLSPLSVAVSDSLHTACLGIFPTDWRGHDNASGTLPWTLHLTSFAARDSIPYGMSEHWLYLYISASTAAAVPPYQAVLRVRTCTRFDAAYLALCRYHL